MKWKVLSLVFLVLATVACDKPATVSFPSMVDEVELVTLKKRITDSTVLKELEIFLSDSSIRWYKSWHTFPSPNETLVLRNKGEEVAYVWIGNNWLGTRAVDGEPVLAETSEVKVKELQILVGMKPN